MKEITIVVTNLGHVEGSKNEVKLRVVITEDDTGIAINNIVCVKDKGHTITIPCFYDETRSGIKA